VHPIPDPLLSFLVVPGIEPGPPDRENQRKCVNTLCEVLNLKVGGLNVAVFDL
jgi:hypothetical protein